MEEEVEAATEETWPAVSSSKRGNHNKNLLQIISLFEIDLPLKTKESCHKIHTELGLRDGHFTILFLMYARSPSLLQIRVPNSLLGCL